MGAYLYITWGIWLRHILDGEQEEYYLSWPHFWSFPGIVRTSTTKHSNGVATSKKDR